MTGMTILKAAAVCGGRIAGEKLQDREIGRVVIDSREIKEGDFFVAYRGEHADGHDYISSALQNGAACCLAEHVPEGVSEPVIVVPDVQDALESVCAAYRESLKLPIVGITGSVGKTSAKEMIWSVLSQKMNTLKTEGNLNNQIGVPMTLSRITPEHEAAVVEMGISGFGEMSKLGRMVKPQIAVFTVIGHAHLEFLHDLDGVFKAKTEMLDYVDEDGVVIINGDDAKLRELKCRQRRISVGLREDCDVRAVEIRQLSDGKTACTIQYGARRIETRIPAYGKHMIYAALEGAAVGFVMGLEDEEIKRGIEAYETVGRRGAVTETGFVTLIDDSYNANPDSMRCAIDSIAERKGRRVCLFGDMLEMGENTQELHREVGRYAKQKGIELVAACGALGKIIAEEAGDIGRGFESCESLIDALPELLKKGDTVLIKASRGMHLERAAEAVKGMREKVTEEYLARPIVLLDLDDTILDFHKAEAKAIRRALTELGADAGEETIKRYSEINRAHWEMLERGELTRRQVLVGRFAALFKEKRIDISPEYAQERYEKYLSAGHYFMPGAEALLEELHKTCRLFILSNGNASVQAGRLESAGISKYFERIFISENIGFNKPSKKFFAECFKEIPNFCTDRAIMIGDSLSSDILGGINAGVKTCWYNPSGKAGAEEIKPDYEIRELEQAAAVIREAICK